VPRSLTQMPAGALGMAFTDRDSPLARGDQTRSRLQDDDGVPFAHAYFGGAGAEYARRHGTRPETFAAIAVKARRHAAHNPNAVFRDPITIEQVLASPPMFGPLTRLQCCPPTCGAAAGVLCSPAFARRHGLAEAVTIRAQALVTDTPATFADGTDLIRLVGYDMTRQAADQVYTEAGVDPADIPVVELHDCFTTNELISYEALRLTPEATEEKFIADADNTYGGRVVVNPSGGLLAKGHPLGATGLAQCAELTWQLRGSAGARQVDDARLALAHNIGLGGACVVTLLEATP
jgi:sterol carrier protein 2